MTAMLIALVANVVAIVLGILSAIVCIERREGWGFFLIASAACSVIPSVIALCVIGSMSGEVS